MDTTRIATLVGEVWGDSITPELVEYIRIPNKSPHFDPEWQAHGHMEDAVALIERWCRSQPLSGLQVEVVRLEGRTPLIFMQIPGEAPGTVLLYGHLDKQPEMSGWRDGLGPWTPVIEGQRLYGRGGADDGYSAFAALTALHALQAQGVAHARCVVVIEACEESGSYDLPHYVEALAPRIGEPDLVVCLDSGAGNYDQLWCTTSLRGLIGGTLDVEVLEEGVHSGDASGIVPSSFRIARQLLGRLEDAEDGTILPGEFHAEIPAERLAQAARAAEVLGAEVFSKFPFSSGVQPAGQDLAALVLARTWRPALEVTGAAGLPALGDAGNVLRPRTELRLSLRLPPTLPSAAAGRALARLLERDPPYRARVRFAADQSSDGWNAPAVSDWLATALERASQTFFGAPAMYMGEGGSIPFMGMLGALFPRAQFVVTGVLGPHSNAHGPNEFLHLPTGEKVTACVAAVLAEHAARA